MSKLVVVGQGYVGLPMAIRAAEAGFEVVGVDVHGRTVDDLNNGQSHIDDVSDAELKRALSTGYRASVDPSSISEADVVVVCVPTPLSGDGGPDLKAVVASAETIGSFLSAGTLCVLESTTYPGTTEEVFEPLVNRGRYTVGEDLFIAFSPERIDPGNKKYGVRNTPKVVGGMTQACTNRARDFYAQFVDTVVPAAGCKEAEMAKLLENTFRHVNIALVNEMVRFCNELDIDLWNAIDCAESKPFGFMAFRPGPGVGGHCIPIDPSYLSHRVKAKLGYAFRMVELAEEINHAAPDYVASRARDFLNDAGLAVNGASVLLVGVSYKPNISDRRESPADPLALRLASWGAKISYHDPLVPEWSPSGGIGSLQSVADVSEVAASSDLTIVLQEHASIDFESLAESAKRILDTKAALPRAGHIARL
ncbi:nucleotide sugar dehydrogenase [Dietzia cercidiphylli]|uniref:nucleotide sugar dehydrogenase n=1 Tax=Dietzia cercidiphylli TaxID=498199 RepID=UPI00223A71DB|nr:nucleotide sugar dehydrogenase [Dietzia cercidiphylli]MCT1516954.1 nucleotide sugar dehydrogenase [Dietzia cercidiphylli]